MAAKYGNSLKTGLRKVHIQVLRDRSSGTSFGTAGQTLWKAFFEWLGILTFTFGRFAKTLRRDLTAVQNALRKPFSNGPVEGHINRLKTLKRQMYGRAGLALLRARLLQTATMDSQMVHQT